MPPDSGAPIQTPARLKRSGVRPSDLPSALMGSATELAQAFVSLSSDIALIIDGQGVITSVVQNARAPMSPAAQDWVGQAWVETVTGETRRKVELLLADVGESGLAKQRQVNHDRCGADADIPVAYTALRLGPQGPVLAVGRDLRAVAAIQQRFQDTQQELERSYWRARQSEARYRQLFQVATDATFVVDCNTQRIVEGNHAAVALLQAESGPLAGRVAEQQFDASSRPALRQLLNQAQGLGKCDEIHVRLAGTHIPMGVVASPLHEKYGQRPGLDAGVRVLLRVRAAESSVANQTPLTTPLARLVDTTAEGIVVCDAAGRLVVANRAFVHLAKLAAAEDLESLQGQDLAQCLGGSASDLPSLMSRVRGLGILQLERLSLRRPDAPDLMVDVTITLLTEGEQESFGFTVRVCATEAVAEPAPLSAQTLALAQAIEALCNSLGDAPLGTLLQRAEHLARGHLVHKALHLHAGSDEVAAQQLGISVQELARLRREHACEAAATLR
jgi:transcriptional regulator PpsR